MVREKAELRRGIIEREEQYYQLKIGKTAVGQLIYFYLVLSSSERVKGLDVKNLSLMITPPRPDEFFHIILNISRSCLVFD